MQIFSLLLQRAYFFTSPSPLGHQRCSRCFCFAANKHFRAFGPSSNCNISSTIILPCVRVTTFLLYQLERMAFNQLTSDIIMAGGGGGRNMAQGGVTAIRVVLNSCRSSLWSLLAVDAVFSGGTGSVLRFHSVYFCFVSVTDSGVFLDIFLQPRRQIRVFIVFVFIWPFLYHPLLFHLLLGLLFPRQVWFYYFLALSSGSYISGVRLHTLIRHVGKEEREICVCVCVCVCTLYINSSNEPPFALTDLQTLVGLGIQMYW